MTSAELETPEAGLTLQTPEAGGELQTRAASPEAPDRLAILEGRIAQGIRTVPKDPVPHCGQCWRRGWTAALRWLRDGRIPNE